MNQQEKEAYFSKATVTLSGVIESIRAYLAKTVAQNKKIREDLPKENEDNKIVQQRLLEHGVQRSKELEVLEESPYFARCNVSFGGEKEEMAFGKFSFIEENIYSWVSPASKLRFEKPGPVSYFRSDGTKRNGQLTKKDQFMINAGKISYLSSESLDYDRQLIYQEYFSNQKKGFVLPEIVAQMEKAQDDVIRAHHKGPFLISGPAGSGKTTLALHRVAYLAQSPDVSDIFVPHKIIVFVQDEGTRDYFSHLLPELGIKGVKIVTFAQWAMQVLDITDASYVYRHGKSNNQKDVYEYAKNKALKNVKAYALQKDTYKTLESVYQDFSEEQKNLFLEQKSKKLLDRFDLTILLQLYLKKHGSLTLMQEYYQMAKSGAAKKKIGRFPISYALVIFDEFQNYLPEQIVLVKSTLDPKCNAAMYVGDMKQQTLYGTIQNWEEARESIPSNRQVLLHKVYRNTKQILTYISSLGYGVTVDEKLREGETVVEKVVEDSTKEIEYIRNIASKKKGSIGVLALDEQYIEKFKHANLGKSVMCMTMNEAQGVEFETVCIVGIEKEMFKVSYSNNFPEYAEEKKKIQKDLLYVALTRAMNELHILGRSKLEDAITW